MRNLSSIDVQEVAKAVTKTVLGIEENKDRALINEVVGMFREDRNILSNRDAWAWIEQDGKSGCGQGIYNLCSKWGQGSWKGVVKIQVFFGDRCNPAPEGGWQVFPQ
jgi:hypothetical protein